MSALSHEPLRVSSEPPEQFTTAVPHAAESVAREPPERVNAAVVARTVSGEYISLPPDAVKSWYDAGEVVMVTSRSLNRVLLYVEVGAYYGCSGGDLLAEDEFHAVGDLYAFCRGRYLHVAFHYLAVRGDVVAA